MPSEGDARTIRKKSSEKKHEHGKEESISIATNMPDTRVGSWKNLFGRRNSPMRAKQVRPPRSLSQETSLEDHTPHGNDLFVKFMLPPAGKSIISEETQRGALCSRKPRNAGFPA